MNTAIKTLGLFPVRVVLHPEVSAEVTVNIARSADEAAEQQRLGRAIISDVAEREREEAAAAAQEAAERVAAKMMKMMLIQQTAHLMHLLTKHLLKSKRQPKHKNGVIPIIHKYFKKNCANCMVFFCC